MLFTSPLIRGTLIRRYKRFLAEVELEDGQHITAHCPNTGSMLTCSSPGSEIALSTSANPKRKYRHTLEIVMDNTFWVGVNTGLSNRLVEEALLAGRIDEFPTVASVTREVKTSTHARLDLKVETDSGEVYMEVKNCSFAQKGVAMFPDAVTARGTKHLKELIRLQAEGKRSALFFLVQREDANRFAPASDIDPLYSKTLAQAKERGVSILAYQARVSPERIEVVRALPVGMEHC